MNKLLIISLFLFFSCKDVSQKNNKVVEDSPKKEIIDSQFNYISYLENKNHVLLYHTEDILEIKYLNNIWEYDIEYSELKFRTFEIFLDRENIGRFVINDVEEIEFFINCEALSVKELCNQFLIF